MSYGYYIICIKPYEIEGVYFDLGYIEKYTSSRPLMNDVNWRKATQKEVDVYRNTPTSKQPKGRYYDYT